MSALADRDTNELMSSPATAEPKQLAAGLENKPRHQSMQRQMFAANGGDSKQTKAYVSPSDAIQSPASQKLAKFKQKQMNKQEIGRNPTARSLFARTVSSCSSGGFDDIDAKKES